MRRVLTILTLLALVLTVSAQQRHQNNDRMFSPERFDAELHQFIAHQACFTPQEAAAFFPIYKEMQKKQRAIYDRQREQGKIKPVDNKGCEKLIKNRDELEVEQKRIQQTYHQKMLSVISASKLYDAIKAEDRFFRIKMRSFGGPMPQGQGQNQGQGRGR